MIDLLPALLLLAAAVGDDPAAAVPPDERPWRVDHRLEADSDRRDRAVFWSPPDSLHLNAARYGENLYRFPPQTVQPGRRYRLSFVYLTAVRGHATFSTRVSQYGSGPYNFLALDGGTLTRPLPVVGKWQAGTVDFTALPNAANVEIDFRLEYEIPIGESWADSIVLKPVGMPILVGP